MKKYYLEVTCENIAEVVPEVIKWNSWDMEHLKVVHNAYNSPDCLLTIPNSIVFIDTITLPLLGLKTKVMAIAHQWDELTQISFSLTPFALAKNTIQIIPLSPKRSLVRVKYEFCGNRVQKIFFPLIARLTRKWNRVVWDEDLPVKLRRQKALEYGFVDWYGLPDHLENRIDRSLTYKCKVPIDKTKGISEEMNLFSLTKK